MSFFMRKQGIKRKPKQTKSKVHTVLKKTSRSKADYQKERRKPILNEDIESESDIETDDFRRHADLTSSEDEEETAQEKKLRLTKQYLEELKTEEAEKSEESHAAVTQRLHQDALEQAGRLHKQIADTYLPVSTQDIHLLRGHKLSVTCIVITPDEKHIFSAGKDCCIIKWDVAYHRKVHIINRAKSAEEKTGHAAHVLCLSISTDQHFLASGDRNKLIHIWNPTTCEHLKTFSGHRGPISGLVFRKSSHQLFSASHDRSVKIWNLDEMAYVETLFGHQDAITGIDSLTRERAVTSGGRDNSLRVWKVVEESQLVFNKPSGTIDCVSLINESTFVSGGDDNSLSVWGVAKRKPHVTLSKAHCGCVSACRTGPGQRECMSQGQTEGCTENWITAVASLQHTDLIASGCKDGQIRLWKSHNDFHALFPVFSIPVAGFINGLKFSSSGSLLVAAVGQEHSLGRWWSLKKAKNAVCIIKLRTKDKT